MKFLFDLGGVFFDWDPNHFFRDIFDSEEERKYFLTEVCNDEWNIQQDAGRTIEEAEFELIPKFPHYEKEIKMYYKNHRKMIRGTYDLSIKILEKLKKLNYSCFVLSNFSVGSDNSSIFFSPGLLPVTSIDMSNSGSNPESLINSFAISIILIGSPMSSINTSPPIPKDPACNIN